jgi:MoxR-like ATPase
MPATQVWDETKPTEADLERIERLGQARERIRRELAKRIVGMDDVVESLLIAFFSGGHALFLGVPGLAKTLLIRTLAEVMDLSFMRIQFTPDLMPSDITGTDIIAEGDEGARDLKFVCGPVFTHILLADEINRTPPKTQAALMEAMEEFQVTCGGVKHEIGRPFFVLATQNPIDQEGTYPLPVAQLDRFMFLIPVDYPGPDEEFEIARLTTSNWDDPPETVLKFDEVVEMISLVRRLKVPEEVARHAMRLARISRPGNQGAPNAVGEWVQWGAGPRAAQYLILGAKARAVLRGRARPTTADVDAIAHPVLRHRILPNFQAEAEGIGSDAVVDSLLEVVSPGREEGPGWGSRFRAWILRILGFAR